MHLSGSVGFTLIDRQARDDEQILVEADRAMYAAKRAKALAVQVPEAEPLRARRAFTKTFRSP